MQQADADRDIDRRALDEIAASLSEVIVGATLLVGRGQYSPYPQHKRVTVLVVDREGQTPVVVWDRFFNENAIVAFCAALRVYAGEVFHGEFDTMYGTPWAYAWTCPPAPLRVYDRKGLLVVIKNNAVHVRRARQWAVLTQSEIARVVGWLSPDWYNREVSIEARNGERLLVAQSEEAMALADPTYDGIDLMCDASWVGRLGKAIAKGLGVPYAANDSALE